MSNNLPVPVSRAPKGNLDKFAAAKARLRHFLPNDIKGKLKAINRLVKLPVFMPEMHDGICLSASPNCTVFLGQLEGHGRVFLRVVGLITAEGDVVVMSDAVQSKVFAEWMGKGFPMISPKQLKKTKALVWSVAGLCQSVNGVGVQAVLDESFDFSVPIAGLRVAMVDEDSVVHGTTEERATNQNNDRAAQAEELTLQPTAVIGNDPWFWVRMPEVEAKTFKELKKKAMKAAAALI